MRACGPVGGEGDLDLAGLGRVGLELPAQADVPAEADPPRRFVGEHPAPAALAAVGAAIDDVAADARLEHHLGQVGLQDVVVGIPPDPDVFGEYAESMLDRCLDLDRRRHLFHRAFQGQH